VTPEWKKAPERRELHQALQMKESDPEQAIRRLEALATTRLGTAAQMAMVNLGIIYDSGFAGRRDSARAEEWFRRAGDLGLREAEFCLARMFRREGRFREALDTLRRSAAVGYAPSMRLLGRMHHDGQGTPRDLGEAHRWMQRAMDRGNVFAKRFLAVWMLKGEFGALRKPVGVLLYLSSVFDAFVILVTRSENDVRVN
jgi:TPR repeat protein